MMPMIGPPPSVPGFAEAQVILGYIKNAKAVEEAVKNLAEHIELAGMATAEANAKIAAANEAEAKGAALAKAASEKMALAEKKLAEANEAKIRMGQEAALIATTRRNLELDEKKKYDAIFAREAAIKEREDRANAKTAEADNKLDEAARRESEANARVQALAAKLAAA